jgi:hypothetical protein
VYSDAALKEELKKWLNRHGKSIKKEYGLYDEIDAKELAKQLVSEIEQAFLGAQKWGNVFSSDYRPAGRVSYRLKNDPEGKTCIHILFPGAYLFRPSLWEDAGYSYRTGSGIDDIFSLFTHGYSYGHSFPAGYWYSDARRVEMGTTSNYWDTRVQAPKKYPARPFITATINKFEAEHPNITVSYPEEWHG